MLPKLQLSSFLLALLKKNTIYLIYTIWQIIRSYRDWIILIDSGPVNVLRKPGRQIIVVFYNYCQRGVRLVWWYSSVLSKKIVYINPVRNSIMCHYLTVAKIGISNLRLPSSKSNCRRSTTDGRCGVSNEKYGPPGAVPSEPNENWMSEFGVFGLSRSNAEIPWKTVVPTGVASSTLTKYGRFWKTGKWSLMSSM